MLGFLKILRHRGGPEGRREAMRQSYRKHLKFPKTQTNIKNRPEDAALYGALSTFYLGRGIRMPEAELWGELTPFLVMEPSVAREALAEYVVVLEGFIDAKRDWLEHVLNDAIRNASLSSHIPHVLISFVLEAETRRFKWSELLDDEVLKSLGISQRGGGTKDQEQTASKDLHALFRIAAEAESAEDLDRAVGAYRRALHLRPDIAEAWNNLGNVYRNQGQLAKAIGAYKRALELKPKLAPTWFNMGVAHHNERDYQQAVAAYRERLRLRPDDATAWYNLGDAYGQIGQASKAIQALSEAVRLNPKLAQAWLNLGVAHNELGQVSEALVAYRHAVTLRPDLAVAWCNMGNVYGAEGQHAEAVKAYREAIRLGIDDVSLWWRLGLIYAAQGDRLGLAEVHQHLKILDSAKADEFFRGVVLP